MCKFINISKITFINLSTIEPFKYIEQLFKHNILFYSVNLVEFGQDLLSHISNILCQVVSKLDTTPGEIRIYIL